MTDTTFHTLRDYPPIPRSMVSLDQQNKYFTLYLDDLTSPKDIPQNRRGTIWVNVPMKVWVWGYLRSEGVGFKGWKREVGEMKDVWAEWDRKNENHNPNMEVTNLGRVLR